MRKLILFLLLSLITININAQKKGARYYVGGLLYCTHTYFINNVRSETSFMKVAETKNYKGSDYSSCATCRYTNESGVSIYSFQDKIYNSAFKLYISYIDKQNCVLVFQSENMNDDKAEIYLAKEVISDN